MELDRFSTHLEKMDEFIDPMVAGELIGTAISLPLCALLGFVLGAYGRANLLKKDDVTATAYLKDAIKTFFQKGDLRKHMKNVDKETLTQMTKKHRKLADSMRTYIKKPNDYDLYEMAGYLQRMSKEDREEAMNMIKGKS
jgi:hypothetical protein